MGPSASCPSSTPARRGQTVPKSLASANPDQSHASLLRNRDFQILLTGDLVSTFGSRMSSLAFPLLAFSITRDPLLVGAVSASGMLALALVGVPAGAFVDRRNKRRVMMASTLCASLVCLGVVACLYFGFLTIGVLIAGAFVISCCEAIYDPANATAVQRVVPKDQLSTAYSIEQGRNGIAGLLGPPVAGIFFSMGRALPFLVDFLTYLVSTVCSALIKRDLSPQREGGEQSDSGTEIFKGVAFVMGHGFLRPMLGIAAILNFALNGFVIMLIVALQDQGTSTAAIGIVQAGSALGLVVGAAAAGMLLRRVRAGVCMLVGTLVVALGMLACAGTVWSWPLAMLCVLLTFICLPTLNAALFTYAMSAAPDGLQGRVRSGIMTLSMLLAPLGPLFGGVVSRTWEAEIALAIFGGLALVCALIVASTTGVRNAPLLSDV